MLKIPFCTSDYYQRVSVSKGLFGETVHGLSYVKTWKAGFGAHLDIRYLLLHLTWTAAVKRPAKRRGDGRGSQEAALVVFPYQSAHLHLLHSHPCHCFSVRETGTWYFPSCFSFMDISASESQGRALRAEWGITLLGWVAGFNPNILWSASCYKTSWNSQLCWPTYKKISSQLLFLRFSFFSISSC